MGTVNYPHSGICTLAVYPDYRESLEQDAAFMEELRKEMEEHGGDIDESLNAIARDYEEDDCVNAQGILSNYCFTYWDVTLKYGYYEGFCVDVENNFPVCYDTWEDKRLAQREVTAIRKCLRELVDIGLVVCFPGWCTKYLNREESLAEIERSVMEMRATVKSTPTWLWYERDQHRKSTHTA